MYVHMYVVPMWITLALFMQISGHHCPQHIYLHMYVCTYVHPCRDGNLHIPGNSETVENSLIW